MEEVGLGLKIPATISPASMEFIILMLILEVEIGLNIPATLPLAIVEQNLMLKGEVDIGLRQANLPTITQVAMVYC